MLPERGKRVEVEPEGQVWPPSGSVSSEAAMRLGVCNATRGSFSFQSSAKQLIAKGFGVLGMSYLLIDDARLFTVYCIPVGLFTMTFRCNGNDL